MSFSDWAYRAAYYYGYRAARLLWRFTKPRHRGAILMLWHDKRVLLVRTSYQDFWTAPGGGMKAHEAPVQAAIREVSEEIGLQFTPEQLRRALAVEHFWDNRHDKVQIFEVEVSDAPKIRIDNREIIEARFFTLAEARSLKLPKSLYHYLSARAAEIGAR
jgi:8-oxo-dGTP pyrophosphatase MutT (NUDIX family)